MDALLFNVLSNLISLVIGAALLGPAWRRLRRDWLRPVWCRIRERLRYRFARRHDFGYVRGLDVPSRDRRQREAGFQRLREQWDHRPGDGWAGVSLWYGANERRISFVERVAHQLERGGCDVPDDEDLSRATDVVASLLASYGGMPED